MAEIQAIRTSEGISGFCYCLLIVVVLWIPIGIKTEGVPDKIEMPLK